MASAQALYYGAHTRHTYGVVSPLTYGAYGVAALNDQCFPQRCQACADSFAGEPAATYNCLAKCGLCDHCKGRAHGQIAECERSCQAGSQEIIFFWPSFSLPDRWCVNNCEAVKAACLGCSGACAAQSIAFA